MKRNTKDDSGLRPEFWKKYELEDLNRAECGASGAGAFLVHGGRHMGRMLRVSLVLLVAVTLTGRLVLEAWGAAVADAEADAATGATAWWGERLREGVFVLLFLWLRLAADVARADLVLFARKSAFLAFFRGIGRTLRHPIRTFGLALGLGLPAFGLILLLGLPMQMIRGDGWVALVALFLIVQLAVWIRWMSRAAVLCGLAYQIRPQDIRPLPSPEERLAA